MAELGALSLRITAEGGDGVLAKLREIDTAAKLTGSKEMGKGLTAAQKFLTQEVQKTIQEYQLLGKTTDVTSKQAIADMRQLAQTQLAYLQSVGASETELLRFAAAVQTFEKRVVAAGVAEKATATSGIAAIQQRIALLSRGATLDATRADAVRKLITIETALTSTLAKGNATAEQRIVLNAALSKAQAGIASGTTAIIAAQSAKNAVDQKGIDAAHTAALAMDRQRTAADKMSPKIRSGASAIAALAIAASTGGGSLTGMATQAGLVGSVMAAEFAPAKWAGYAAGIGAVVIGITALVGIIRKLNEVKEVPDIVLKRFGDTRSVAVLQGQVDQARKVRDDLKKQLDESQTPLIALGRGAGQAMSRQRQLAREIEQQGQVVAVAEKALAERRGEEIARGAELAKEAITQAAENTKTVRLSELAKEQAEVEARFQAGTATLSEQYKERRRIIVELEKAERAALAVAQAQKLKPVAGETAQDRKAREIDASAIGAQITALAAETAAKLTALDATRANEERALAAKVLGYQVQLESFTDVAFTKRIEQIRAEDAERRKALAQRGDATAEELAALDALTKKQEARLFLEKAQADVARLRASEEVAILGIENQRLAGLLSVEEASQAIADIQRSAGPAIREAVDRAIEWAAKLGDDGVLGQLKLIRAELGKPINLNIDISTDLITKRLNEAIERIQAAVNSGALSEAAGRDLVLKAGLGAGIASGIADAVAQAGVAGLQGKNPFQALGQVLSSSLGSLLVEVGTQWLKASTLMATIQKAFTLNPIAAIAAAAALIVFGNAIGGHRGGSVSGGLSGSTAAAASPPLSVRRLVIDPNAGIKQRIAGAGAMAIPASGPVGDTIQVIGINSPRGQELIGTANDRYTRRRS